MAKDGWTTGTGEARGRPGLTCVVGKEEAGRGLVPAERAGPPSSPRRGATP